MDLSSETFSRESARYLVRVYLPRLGRALDGLDPAALWWRPGPESLSFGTILLHLEGNVRQWIVSGLGGAKDVRDREAEFAAEDGPSGEELLARLVETVESAARIIEACDGARLAERVVLRGEEQSVGEAIYHVVEHFAWHGGQACWIAKARPRGD